MGFKIAISPQAQKYLKCLEKDEARIIKGHINGLRTDPYTPRPLCDIIKQRGKRPPIYRLRAGKHRAEYFIEGDTVFISRRGKHPG
jgi:mRNA-degrading endonuclease RelE of RelBE toxin-antitoxin system